MSLPDKKPHELLHELLDQNPKLWRHTLELKIRLDNLYWFLYLMDQGITHRLEEYKKKGRVDACEIASIGSWQIDTNALFEQARDQLVKGGDSQRTNQAGKRSGG